MKNLTRLISSTVLLTSALFVSSTLACTTDAWTDADAGLMAGDPKADDIARVSGFCGLKITADLATVGDNSPTDEPTFIGRFYFFPKNVAAGDHDIFTALSDQTDPNSDVFVISYNDGTITLDATAVGGTSVSVAADTSHWNLIEFKWVSGDTGSLWVGIDIDATADPASGTFDSGTSSIDRITLGDVNAGLFDDYESHRSLPVGALLMGDANGNGSLTIADAIGLFNELGGTLQPGQPDCNSNGGITIADAICLFNAL